MRSRYKALAKENPAWKEILDNRLPYIGAEVVWATRYEMARHQSKTCWPEEPGPCSWMPGPPWIWRLLLPGFMAIELKKDEDWEKEQVVSFLSVAKNYIWLTVDVLARLR